jgi:predicted nucleic acid-binding protein
MIGRHTSTDSPILDWRRAQRSGSVTGNLVPDAQLATLAIEHALVVCSADADFARFPDVHRVNPLRAR